MSSSKVALVTGSSSGIGEAIAYQYASMGYHVALTGRNEKRLNDTAAKCKKLSPNNYDALAIPADFVDTKQVDEVFHKTISHFKQLHILINNAGYGGESKSIDDPDFMKDYHNIMTVNLTSAVRLCHLALPHLKKTKGSIVNISSISSRMGSPSVSYPVSKAGMSMLTKTLANSIGKSGVRVNSVSPGPIVTRITPDQAKHGVITLLGRSGQPEEVANLVTFLTSDKATFIQGAEFDIDGGAIVKCPELPKN